MLVSLNSSITMAIRLVFKAYVYIDATGKVFIVQPGWFFIRFRTENIHMFLGNKIIYLAAVLFGYYADLWKMNNMVLTAEINKRLQRIKSEFS